MSRTFRIALGALMTECNHLGGVPTDLERFEQSELKRGDELFDNPTGAVAGMVGVLSKHEAEVLPLLVATACPGAPLTASCREALCSEMLARLQVAMPVDGVLFSLHGSVAAEDEDDVEGDLLAAARELVGEGVPIVASLDTHGHVTQLMIDHADALLGFATYPHEDTAETGARSARLLLDILNGSAQPVMVMAKMPVLVSGVNGTTTGDGAFARIMRYAKAREGRNEVLSTSLFLVHPYLDLPDMGGGGLVIANGDETTAETLARELAAQYWDARFDLEPETFTPEEAIARGMKIEGGPVLLVECADCSGGGAAGDSIHTLRALLEADLTETSLAPVVDAEAAALCHAAGQGNEIELELGHKLDPKWGEPLRVRGEVLRLGSGEFVYSGGNWDGTTGHMGLCAVLKIGSVQVLITSNATYDWADEQFRAMGMEARNAKFVVVKNPMNYRIGYDGVARGHFILDTPGPTPATLRNAHHQRVQRPYFPLDEQIPDLQPQILKRRR